ncbi:hypothetical protein ACFWBF_36105 [Streptomyces sp. NPDC060028]|uniref:hypothetical protein n=1 Tax=Streptomyces sp. NPDC060028 TaxID=3347041 RepID=UPI00367D10BF
MVHPVTVQISVDLAQRGVHRQAEQLDMRIGGMVLTARGAGMVRRGARAALAPWSLPRIVLFQGSKAHHLISRARHRWTARAPAVSRARSS